MPLRPIFAATTAQRVALLSLTPLIPCEQIYNSD